jgi:(E)-4-hydroxy-3-methylbut-2-enyl-diphosphate synthase
MIAKRKLSVKVGNTIVGSNYPITIQSMTDTDTKDLNKTVDQILELVRAGSEIVRVTVDNLDSAKNIIKIKEKLLKVNCSVPIVGCFHYNGHSLLSEVPSAAEALDKYRINPGNLGVGDKKDKNFETIVKIAIKNQKPIRIGVNWGSLDQNLLAAKMDQGAKNSLSDHDILVETLVESALTSAQRALELGLSPNQIILSAKTSRIDLLKRVYKELDRLCNYPLHLGLTEAGMGLKGVVSTVAALTSLLDLGIGNTIRASITPKPGEARTQEVLICKELLQSLGLRSFSPQITSCPGCGRTKGDAFRNLTWEVNQLLDNLNHKYKNLGILKVAVMGCIVNGPGESKEADIGISLPGKGEEEVAIVFTRGEKTHTLRGSIVDQFKEILLQFIENNFEKSSKL